MKYLITPSIVKLITNKTEVVIYYTNWFTDKIYPGYIVVSVENVYNDNASKI